MSKITKALEKAARERLRRRGGDEPTVKARGETIIPVSTSAPVIEPGTGAPARFSYGEPLHEVRIDPHIVGATDPTSPISEQYRILRTNIMSLQKKPGPKAVMITSAINSEGKSVTSLNLALTFARQENMSVALLDADMRKSSVAQWLGIKSRGAGLSTVLQNRGELNGELVTLSTPPLTILPAGPIPDNPAELLHSAAMKRLMAALKARFDLIIVDAPPVLPVADPGIIAEHCDGVLLVVRSGKTQRKTVAQAYTRLEQTKANMLGCVMTHMEYFLPGYARYYHYYKSDKPKGQERDAA